MTEIIHLYFATGLVLTETNHEAHEVMEVHWVGYDEALYWIVQGKITDAKTIVGLYKAKEHLLSRVCV